ncbi:MAG: hypothetical protein QGI68_20215 [Pseudomonadales bacterium]|jgi:hypothetical protein|nr:hypothetical protein [Pseudomonadales bacterium]MDP7357531.1 hypothetical protein [Pseudomonadales bacterium]MDP7597870.1 hypothetical protein [Pseudomonadales bacterium]HJN51106.1 hypothetical protein [Pseudomonadales bacterium]|tara:strand:+ start:798 stop:1715 length:918 start_codon:yes stop_codon:yes gene_type:complete
MLNPRHFVVLAASVASPGLGAATCSCAGVPLLGAMESTAPDKGKWYLSTTFEAHEIDKLVKGSSTVRDETGRDRSSESLMAEVSYGINQKWSVSALLSRIGHERQIGANSSVKASGFGDSILMVKFSPWHAGLFSRYGLSVGLGAKIATGKDDETKNQVVLAEDMQPSTGANSFIFWAHGNHTFSQSGRTEAYLGTSYSRNSDNDRRYEFGDEFTLTLGASHRLESRWGFNGSLKYRKTDRDQRNSTDIPNTGGEWLDFVPAVQYHFTDNLAARLSGRIPVWRDLNDELQFTTTYAYSLSVSYVL